MKARFPSLASLLLLPAALYGQAAPSYEEVQAVYAAEGAERTEGIDLEISATAYAAASAGAVELRAGIGGLAESVLVWEKEDSFVEYAVDAPRDGLYTISILYYPLPGRRGAAQREVWIDGELPFREAATIELPRLWADEGAPRKDNRGSDIRPRQVETPFWRWQILEDSLGLAREPLQFHLHAGRNFLRLVARKEPVALRRIRVASPVPPPPYAAVEAAYAEAGYAPASGALVKIQAEQPAWKTDPTIRMESSIDLRAEPPAGTRRIFNVFGSWRWRAGNQLASWSFSVPAPGLYAIAMKVYQDFSDGLPSVRSVAIDGVMPFRELEEVLFPSSRGAQLVTLGGAAHPYLFWLEAGRHSIEMRVTIGPVRSVISTIERAVQDSSRLQRLVYLITGVNPDPNREWDDLPERVPDLLPGLKRMAAELSAARDVLVEIAGGGHPPAANTLAMASEQFLSMAAKPQSIPSRLGDLSGTVSALVKWLLDMKSQPLEIDWIALTDPALKLPPVRAGLLERIAASWNSFVASFTGDISGVGSRYGEGEAKVLEVWVARGREYAEIIKDLADEDFTAATGVRVNLNVIPADQMQAILLNALVGEAPDVALGISPDLPVNLGVRGALVNLHSFADYSAIASRFRPGSLVPFRYSGSDFALPETQSFSMLFYRTDILGELHLAVPQTWDEVKAMLPELQKNGLNFYYAGVSAVPGQVNAGLLPFLLQNGGSFYDAEGMSALDQPAALEAFRQWTELYTAWRVPQLANFYSQFRTGELPIGVSDYYSYVQFHTAAPELAGRWEMAPIPGTRSSDGTIDRSAGGAGAATILFSQSKRQREGWEFLKWWTSTEVQVRFGEELEALLGVSARWNTANVEALRSLPWPNRDIAAVMAQWEWFREQPIVLGGYFTDRHVQNAWNRVVLQGANPREALEIAVEDIDRELRRKQEEFGLHPTARVQKALGAEVEAQVLVRNR